jgi:hypothetical protein
MKLDRKLNDLLFAEKQKLFDEEGVLMNIIMTQTISSRKHSMKKTYTFVGASVSWRLMVGASGCRDAHQCYGSGTSKSKSKLFCD